jgi:exonuclease SbcD
MRILHTSDWHLGKTLQRRLRYHEFDRFLTWLVECVERERIDVLLLAGDVFDTTTPNSRAQALYFGFLAKAREAGLQHVVVIGGNHDSPSLLEATESLLRAHQIHVIGGVTEDRFREVLMLRDRQGEPALIVGAVPYLRERDVRTAELLESPEDKARDLQEGIRRHYAAVADAARSVRSEIGLPLPMIFMGHLFAAGGRVRADDGMRDLYVGTLAHVPADVFPADAAYVALGHLHSAQVVAGQSHIRYSGSPLPMGFGEFGQTKSVVVVDLAQSPSEPRLLQIPSFQRLETVRGDLAHLEGELSRLSSLKEDIWVDAIYEGEALVPDLRERLEKIVAGSTLTLLRIRNDRLLREVFAEIGTAEDLEEFTESQVFDLCLKRNGILETEAEELRSTFEELLQLHAQGDGPDLERGSP